MCTRPDTCAFDIVEAPRIIRAASAASVAGAPEDPRGLVENAAPRRRGPKGLLGPRLFHRFSPRRPIGCRMHGNESRLSDVVGPERLSVGCAAVQSPGPKRGIARWKTWKTHSKTKRSTRKAPTRQ